MHGRLVFGRRVRKLADHLAAALPDAGSVLDVGCGDGSIDVAVLALRPRLRIIGIDVLVRERTHIPVMHFDGTALPFPDHYFDVVMFVDVLHHTPDPSVLLAEARRVARRAVVLKDHTRDGLLAGATLRLMDWVGNAHHGVALPYNYWPEAAWRATFESLKLRVDVWEARLGLYPWPVSLVFDRSLHFIARLVPA
jgi:SAM-dependent methyltransferase